MSERPNYAEECQVDRDCHNPRVRSEPACAVHARALAAEAQVAHYREALERIASRSSKPYRRDYRRDCDCTSCIARDALSLPPTPTTDPPIQSTEADNE